MAELNADQITGVILSTRQLNELAAYKQKIEAFDRFMGWLDANPEEFVAAVASTPTPGTEIWEHFQRYREQYEGT